MGMEPAGVESDNDSGEGLDDPDAADELGLDGVFLRQEHDEHKRAELHHEGYDLGDIGFLFCGAVGAVIFPVDIAGIEVGCRDGHDGRWHEGPDGDGREGEAARPVATTFWTSGPACTS